MKMYQAIAVVQMRHKTERVESGLWDSISKAQDELCFFVSKILPIGESFKVVQSIKHFNL